ncbi:hypothetical protein HID58_033440 [Brassica napus]|uniref:Uncharacterized protein n=1 Tax=Brassica napus TaxID=3708 RepID=A0ABQ8BZ79_BRANA|nr:hypothetical protein HID58_033440 [Brassica napus]
MMDVVGYAHSTRDGFEVSWRCQGFSPGGACSLKDGLSAWRCLVLRRRLSGQASPVFVLFGSWRWCLESSYPGSDHSGFQGLRGLVLHFPGHLFCLICSILSRKETPSCSKRSIMGGVHGFVVMELGFHLCGGMIRAISSQCRGGSFDLPRQIWSFSFQCRSRGFFDLAASFSSRSFGVCCSSPSLRLIVSGSTCLEASQDAPAPLWINSNWLVNRM